MNPDDTTTSTVFTTDQVLATWDADILGQALLRSAHRQGDWSRIAATQLLVSHGVWLHRKAFRVFVIVEGYGYASVNLPELGAAIDDSPFLRASSSETAIARLACSLGGYVPLDGDPVIAARWSLRSILRPLDGANAGLAVEAIRYAALGYYLLGPAVGGGR